LFEYVKNITKEQSNNTIQNKRKPDKEGMMSDIYLYKMRQDKLIKNPADDE
jgi:hypothetical protein